MRVDGSSDHVLIQLKGQLQRGPTGAPMINGVPLVGDIPLPRLGLRGIYYDKSENWNAQLDFIGAEGSVYIYSDYRVKTDDNGNEVKIPNIKIGDGTTPLIDRPFLTSEASETIVDTIMGEIEERVTESVVPKVITRLENEQRLVSAEDRLRWDGKITGDIDPENPGNLILSF